VGDAGSSPRDPRLVDGRAAGGHQYSGREMNSAGKDDQHGDQGVAVTFP
jgi:hypothetical protein